MFSGMVKSVMEEPHMKLKMIMVRAISDPDTGFSTLDVLNICEQVLESGMDASQLFSVEYCITERYSYSEMNQYVLHRFGQLLSPEAYAAGVYKRQEGFIHEAARKGHLGVVKCLLKHGVPVDSLNGQNHTALFQASLAKQYGVVKYLIENGADVNRSFGYLGTALHQACSLSLVGKRPGGIALVKILLDAGADVFAKAVGFGSVKEVAIRGRTRASPKDKPAFDLVIAMLEKAMTFEVTKDAIEIPAAELQCSICHDVSEQKDWCHVACCNSQFHVDCMTHWIDCSTNKDCPLCRGYNKTARKVVPI